MRSSLPPARQSKEGQTLLPRPQPPRPTTASPRDLGVHARQPPSAARVLPSNCLNAVIAASSLGGGAEPAGAAGSRAMEDEEAVLAALLDGLEAADAALGKEGSIAGIRDWANDLLKVGRVLPVGVMPVVPFRVGLLPVVYAFKTPVAPHMPMPMLRAWHINECTDRISWSGAGRSPRSHGPWCAPWPRRARCCSTRTSTQRLPRLPAWRRQAEEGGHTLPPTSAASTLGSAWCEGMLHAGVRTVSVMHDGVWLSPAIIRPLARCI